MESSEPPQPCGPDRAAAPPAEASGTRPAAREQAFTDICCDSRAARPGSLFVALGGARTDGHLHVREAVERGAVGLVIEQGRLADIPGPLRDRVVAEVENTRLALAHLAADFHGHPSRRLLTIGITGTNGKTTVASLVAHIWNNAPAPPGGGGCGYIGTLGIRAGRDFLPTELTTPEAPDLQAALARMFRAGLRGAVIEVSSQGINHHRIAGIAFAVAALTQITHDHSDVHPSFEAYRQLKLSFLRDQPRRTRVVVNGDDPAAEDLMREVRCPERLFTYGTAPEADLRIASVRPGPAGLQLDLVPSARLLAAMEGAAGGSGGKIRSAYSLGAPRSAALSGTPWRLATPLLGRHNGHNVAAASLIALLAGCGLGAVLEGVRSFRGPERRLQLYNLRGRYVLDDTAMNPASYEAAFEAARALGLHRSGGRFILVCAVRGNRGPAINAQNGAVIARWASRLPLHRIIVTESEESVGERDRVTPQEREALEGALRARALPWKMYDRLLPALEAAWEASRPGDGILLLGAQGMDDGWPLLQSVARR